jgi:cephalosporin hydroxylase
LLLQTPVDLWLFEELLQEVRPRLVVESGVLEGGFSWWLIDRLRTHLIEADFFGIDVVLPDEYPFPAVKGDAADPAVIAQVVERMPELGRRLIILDDDHDPDHVVRELDQWKTVLRPEDFIVVCDTVPVPELEEAVHQWASRSGFVSRCDRFGLSNHRGGWLTREGA